MRQVLPPKRCKLRAQGLRSLGSVPGFREFRLADCSFRVLRAFGPACNAGASIIGPNRVLGYILLQL